MMTKTGSAILHRTWAQMILHQTWAQMISVVAAVVLTIVASHFVAGYAGRWIE